MGAAAYMSENATKLNIAIFTVNFTIFRAFVCPTLWWGIWVATWEHRNNPVSQACLPWHFTYIVFVFGKWARSVTMRCDATRCKRNGCYDKHADRDFAAIFFLLCLSAFPGMFFNILNSYWMMRIVQKMIRKFSGTEKWKSKNHVKHV